MSGKFMLNGTEYLGGGSGSGGGNVDDVLVNGISVVNEDKEAEIVSYKEVTQAEYNALPSSKLTDDIMYCIKDVGGADSFPPLIYSDEEREIGVWRDGKPLYQKTVRTGAIRTTIVNVAHNISNIDNIIKIFGYAKIDSGIFVPLPFVQFGASAADYQIRVHADTTNISISTTNLNDGADSYVTLQYTKTTDTAGSGIWTTQGGYAHHYSTDEQVIGTWTDGSTLYEKTKVIPVSSTSVINNIREIPFLETGQVLKRIVYAFANDTTYGDISLGTQSYVSNSNMSNNWGFCRWYGGLAIYTTNTNYWSNLSDITVIYQYTKSSS